MFLIEHLALWHYWHAYSECISKVSFSVSIMLHKLYVTIQEYFYCLTVRKHNFKDSQLQSYIIHIFLKQRKIYIRDARRNANRRSWHRVIETVRSTRKMIYFDNFLLKLYSIKFYGNSFSGSQGVTREFNTLRGVANLLKRPVGALQWCTYILKSTCLLLQS